MNFIELDNHVSLNQDFNQPRTLELFTPEFLSLLAELQSQFYDRRQNLLENRKQRQEKYDEGELPQYLPKNSPAVTSNWEVSPIPQDLLKRRVEITGPVNDTKMVINMLSRNDKGARADTAMLDFEDSMCPWFSNVIDGVHNVIGAARGNLSFLKEGSGNKAAKKYELDSKDMAGLMVRVRGLHMEEKNVQVDGRPVPAGLFDLAACFFHTAKTLIEKNKTPKYYVPKCEHFEEARWWNDLFTALEKKLNLPVPSLRATFLIETLPAAFQIEEILFEIKEHAAGLNVGRWDKIFSDIKVLRNHPDRIAPDRATINMSKFWMDNYAKRLVKICHAHGAFAIGGMSAFTPGKTPEIREAQTNKVIADKTNEAKLGHDGCWVSHPYFIGYALSAFKKDHQLDVKLEDFDKYPDLIMDGLGPKTIEGLRTNCRVGIAYMQGWNQGIGCVAFDGLMEDLATLEISRAQTWQWLHHKITLDSGEQVNQTLIKRLFEEEFQNIANEFSLTGELKKQFETAKDDAFKIFTASELKDFLTI
ncbi:MAG: malate synthase A [Halobacteriovoraceae bacterium]|nr:malate synthase A [Halobacteriovoraceae bacterium]